MENTLGTCALVTKNWYSVPYDQIKLGKKQKYLQTSLYTSEVHT